MLARLVCMHTCSVGMIFVDKILRYESKHEYSENFVSANISRPMVVYDWYIYM